MNLLNRSRFCLLTAILLLASELTSAAEKPNILFIFADDLTYQAVHALGNDEIQTPNLDGLVREGLTFTHCYNQGGWNGAVLFGESSDVDHRPHPMAR